MKRIPQEKMVGGKRCDSEKIVGNYKKYERRKEVNLMVHISRNIRRFTKYKENYLWEHKNFFYIMIN